jgi:clan AA aspartic protease (TIGR02281 family)
LAQGYRIKGKFEHYGVLVVPVEVNGISLDWMVDSGASFCAISSRVVAQMGLEIDRTQSISVAPAFGRPLTVPVSKVTSIRVGINMIKDVFVTILDFPAELRFRGLLGMNFLKNFRFTIEPDTATLVLRRISKF